MPTNKLALIRYKTIDACLRNRQRKWALDDLIESVSDALYDYEGIDSGVSKRTIQLDIQNMRSDKLGYNAPIVVVDRKYYTYDDPEYSITNNALSDHDLEVLQDTLRLLGQFQGFNYFEDIGAMVTKIESRIDLHTTKENKYIDFEKNELLVGLNWIDILLKAVKQRSPVEIVYQSFKSRNPQTRIYHPYMLKEYRNRWFVLANEDSKKSLFTLALDRIKSVRLLDDIKFYPATRFDPNTFYDNVIGVSKNVGNKTMRVVLHFDNSNAPYVITKPLHSSQKILNQENGELTVEINVVHNFELERVILGFGESVKVISPKILVKRIREKHEKALGKYNE